MGFENFDKRFEDQQKMVNRFMVISAVAGLAIAGVLGWAIVRLVLHFTG